MHRDLPPRHQGQDHPFLKRIAPTPLAPSAPLPPLRGRQSCTSLTVALPTGCYPCDKRYNPRVAPCGQAGVVPVGNTSIGVAPVGVWPWLAAPVEGLAMAGHPCRGLGYDRPPSFLAVFIAKIQQEHVERFYVIQTHYT
ncbi:hypothetical protein GW17_00049685 [Ensete ventricosum]|nr:hypothetical protein GW17_00049685 [Ensete ventricosum]